MSSLLPEPELQQQFARRRLRQLLLILPVFVSILALRALDDAASMPFGLSHELVAGGALVFLVGAVAFSFWNWRCPACSKYLGKTMSPKFCQKCGFKLQP